MLSSPVPGVRIWDKGSSASSSTTPFLSSAQVTSRSESHTTDGRPTGLIPRSGTPDSGGGGCSKVIWGVGWNSENPDLSTFVPACCLWPTGVTN